METQASVIPHLVERNSPGVVAFADSAMHRQTEEMEKRTIKMATVLRPLYSERHDNGVCEGYGKNFLHPTIAIARMLEAADAGFRAPPPILVTGAERELAKLLHVTPGCPECEALEAHHREEIELIHRVSRPEIKWLRPSDPRHSKEVGRPSRK